MDAPLNLLNACIFVKKMVDYESFEQFVIQSYNDLSKDNVKPGQENGTRILINGIPIIMYQYLQRPFISVIARFKCINKSALISIFGRIPQTANNITFDNSYKNIRDLSFKNDHGRFYGVTTTDFCKKAADIYVVVQKEQKDVITAVFSIDMGKPLDVLRTWASFVYLMYVRIFATSNVVQCNSNASVVFYLQNIGFPNDLIKVIVGF